MKENDLTQLYEGKTIKIESMINEMTSGISDGTGLDSIKHM